MEGNVNIIYLHRREVSSAPAMDLRCVPLKPYHLLQSTPVNKTQSYKHSINSVLL